CYRLTPAPRTTLFRYTTLFRSLDKIVEELLSNSYLAGADRVNLSTAKQNHDDTYGTLITTINQVISDGKADSQERQQVDTAFVEDRKSTRLNSSHVKISYAVYC